jgi:signal transduction histidine kinase
VNLREKLALAFLPLLAGLILVGGLSSRQLATLGARTERVFADNYRSVLAAQRLKEFAERLDSASLIALSGDQARGREDHARFRKALEDELRVQEGNITEPGEEAVTRELRTDWERYDVLLGRFFTEPAARSPSFYFDRLEPAFLAFKGEADRVLVLNQDAMVLKNRDMEQAASCTRRLLLVVALASTLLGAWASYSLLRRLLRPLESLGLAVQRLAAGDLAARAAVGGSDEIARLAKSFDAMAARLEEYRRSSLGDLLQAQAASQSAIDSLPDPVLVFGLGNGLLSANRAAASVGIVLEGSAHPLAAADPALRTLIERVRAHVLQGKGSYAPAGFEEAVRSGGPTERWFLPRATPLHAEEGRIVGATVVLQDVTRLHRFDELKNDLVSTVAHEFRTPLTSLRMAIHFLAEEAVGPLTPKQAEFLGAAREDCERLQGIVEDLLDLARVQSGRLDLVREPVNASELLDSAARRHDDEAKVRGVRVVVEPGPDVPVLVDRSRLDLVFDNLLENALRHTPANGAIALRATDLDHAVRFEVQDTGSGIPSEHLRSVFERFFRVPGAPPGGAGLGLSIVQEIVRAHGGEVGVESEVGRGSTFWLTIPRPERRGDEAPGYSVVPSVALPEEGS